MLLHRSCKQNNAHSYAKGCYPGVIVRQVVKAKYMSEAMSLLSELWLERGRVSLASIRPDHISQSKSLADNCRKSWSVVNVKSLALLPVLLRCWQWAS